MRVGNDLVPRIASLVTRKVIGIEKQRLLGKNTYRMDFIGRLGVAVLVAVREACFSVPKELR